MLRAGTLCAASRAPPAMSFKSRFLRIVLVVLLVLGFGGYFAFSTFLFNPLEGAYGSDIATLVPRNVDFFVAKARLGQDFAPFPHLALEKEIVATQAWRTLAGSPDRAELERALNLPALQAGLEQLTRELRGLDPLKIFGGRELAVAGWIRGPDLARTDWAVYGRANWLGKLGVSLLDFPALLGLERRGINVAVEADHVTLSGGQLIREIHLTRVRDVVVAGTSLELVRGAHELEARAGQDSFGQSAQYFDHIQNANRTARRDELQAYVDWRALSERAQLSGRFPDPTSADFLTALAGHFFQLGSLKAVAGVIGAEEGLRAHLHADLSSELITPEQARLYRRRGADRREILAEVAALAPDDTGLLLYLHVSIGDLLRQMLAAAEADLRSNLDDLLRSSGKFTGADQLIDELDGLFRDRVALILRRNDYITKPEEDPPSDGQPMWAISVVLWSDGSAKVRERIDELHNLVVRNSKALGLVGRAPGEAGVYHNYLASGHEIWEFWSQFVAGTGHIATVIDSERYVLSNNFRMLHDLIKTLYQLEAGHGRLSDDPRFRGLLDQGLAQANACLWIDPRQIGVTARQLFERQARDAVLGGLDMVAQRAREEALILREEFGGRPLGALGQDEKQRLGEVLDARMASYQERALNEDAPELATAYLRQLQYAEVVSCAMLMLALDPKSLELSLGVLF